MRAVGCKEKMSNHGESKTNASKPWGTAVACFALLSIPLIGLAVARAGIWSDYTVSVEWFALRMPPWLAWYSYVVARSIPAVLVLSLAVPAIILVMPALHRRSAKLTCLVSSAVLHLLLFLGHWAVLERMTNCGFALALFFWVAAPFHGIRWIVYLVRGA